MALHYKQNNKTNFSRLYLVGDNQIALRCFGGFTVHQGKVYKEFFDFLYGHYADLDIRELDNSKPKQETFSSDFHI